MILNALFIGCFIVIIQTARDRKLNSFQKVGMLLLLFGCMLRVVLISVDLLNILLTGEHFIEFKSFHQSSFILGIFISAPEIFFTFPLFAIGLDFLEISILLSSKQEVTP